MEFYNKVAVLKEIESGFSISNKPVSGILRLEVDCGVCSVCLSLINLKNINNGEYRLYILDSKKRLFTFNVKSQVNSLNKTLTDIPDTSLGLLAGLVYLSNGLPTLICVGGIGSPSFSILDLKKRIIDKCLQERKSNTIQTTKLEEEQTKVIDTKVKKEKTAEEEFIDGILNYNDEVVATVNYYDEKLADSVLEKDDAPLRNKDELRFNSNQEEAEKIKNDSSKPKNEKSFDASVEYSEKHPYYQSVKDEIEGLFSKFPVDDSLRGVIPNGKFIKIYFSDTLYYIVGVIKEKDKEKYVCYGVPGVYSNSPPKELKGYCSFIPLSVFDMHGKGYWMMFQDAVSGACVKP